MAIEQSHLVHHIGNIRKNNHERLSVSVKEFKGCRYIDIRHVFINQHGQDMPKAGLTIGLKGVSTLIEYLQEGQRFLIRRDQH